MWTSSRRWALPVFVVLVLGTGAYSLGWLSTLLPIEVGQTETGEIANTGTEGSEPIPPMTSESSESQLVFVSQSEPNIDPPEGYSTSRGGFANRERVESRPADETTQALFGGRQTVELPNQFPNFETPAESGSIRRPRSSKPPERRAASQDTIQPAGFQMPASENEGSSGSEVREPRTGRRGFESAEPRTLADSQRFPSTRIALLDRNQNPEQDTEPLTETEPKPASLPAAVDTLAPEPEFKSPRTESKPAAPKPARLATRPNSGGAGSIGTGSVGTGSVGSGTGKIDLEKIDRLMTTGDVVAAQRELSGAYWNQPELRPVIMERLERNAQAIYLVAQMHYVEPYVIQSGDQLQTIAAKYQISWPYLAQLNKVDPKRIRAGQKLKVIKGPFSAFVDLSDFELTVHAHGFFVKRFSVGVGKDGSSPIGKFTVLDKIEKAQYTDPKGKVIAGGAPNNPLGTHWIDLGKSYGLHGTIEPDSIGKAESRGCIRLRNEDAAEVYHFLVKGSEVVIRQ